MTLRLSIPTHVSKRENPNINTCSSIRNTAIERANTISGTMILSLKRPNGALTVPWTLEERPWLHGVPASPENLGQMVGDLE